MNIYELKVRKKETIKELYDIWEKSVIATHLFLTENDIKNISKYVMPALEKIGSLIILEYKNKIAGFIGIENKKIEMLFLDPINIGLGFGRKLIEYVKENYGVNEVAVNEQNENAHKFYEHMGFKVYKRSEYDEQGNHFPILYMRF
ncbi:GNAT family N-acetyltransferase [Brachyspira innocens]|uniref:GNAT family N-acetyltransferase n=1 Tax=Brachyspira innocens TaxID=13264 RepID=UPI0026E98116|nr:GNAT family N-acetyltransferase [Brachyspira innocens]